METVTNRLTGKSQANSGNIFVRLTIADGLLGFVVAATAVSRFINLAQIPLSPDEAAQAFASWQFWQPVGQLTGSAITGGSPAYFSLTSLLFPLLGDSDAIARLIPALFGLSLVLLPWLLRQRLGTVGALAASLLLAISPTQTIVSRTAGGDAIALFALLLIIVGWLRYEAAGGAVGRPSTTNEQRWFTTMFAGLALGLTSSPLFYGGLTTLALTGLVQWRSLQRALFAHVDGDVWRKTAVTAAVLFLALSSLFLWHLPGLGAAATLPANWLTQFRFSGAGLFDPLLALLRYEPFLVLGGAAAAAWAIRSNNRLAKQLISWLVGIILLMLLQRGQMGNAALFTLPGSLLAGLMADDLLRTRPSRLSLAWAGGLFFLSGLILVNLARFTRVVIVDPQDFTSVWMILMGFTAALVTVYFISLWEGTAVAQGAFLALFAFFALYQWGMGWQLAHISANDPRERWVTTATDDDVTLLINTLKEISRQATNSDYELDIFSSVNTPVLRWYLRDFKHLQFGDSLPVGAQNDVLISPIQADLPVDNELAPGSNYAGADYGLIRIGLLPPETPSLQPELDALRWWLFNESSLAIEEERVILWWRVDLTKE